MVEQLVQPGAVVNPGTSLFSLDRSDRRQELVSLAYFASQDGKRLKPGQIVRITPTTTKAQRHGGIRGRILSLRTLPVSREGLRQRLGLESLVQTVQPAGSSGNDPLIEAVTSLQRDPATRSGFDWGGGPGPDLGRGVLLVHTGIIDEEQNLGGQKSDKRRNLVLDLFGMPPSHFYRGLPARFASRADFLTGGI